MKETTADGGENRLVTIPSDLLATVFGNVSYRQAGQEVEVTFEILVPPAEPWNSIVAIDASESMRPLFGKALTGDIPLPVQEDYHRRNLILVKDLEGRTQPFYQPEAFEDALAKGYLHWTPNEIEPLARDLLEFLGRRIDAREACNLMYWGCEGVPGWAEIGEIKCGACRAAPIALPGGLSFGKESRLLPVLKRLAAAFSQVPRTMVVFLTDGHFSDLEEVLTFSAQLAMLIKAGERRFAKFVAIGIGRDINRKNLTDLVDMKIGREIELWDVKIASEMKDLGEIFTGIVSEDQIIAPQGRILDAHGKVVKEFPNGLPAKVAFRMPLASASFSLQIPASEKRYQQSLMPGGPRDSRTGPAEG